LTRYTVIKLFKNDIGIKKMVRSLVADPWWQILRGRSLVADPWWQILSGRSHDNAHNCFDPVLFGWRIRFPVSSRSSHSKQIDVALNDICRLVTGCMKATPMDKLYLLSGIAPPSARREVSVNSERSRQ